MKENYKPALLLIFLLLMYGGLYAEQKEIYISAKHPSVLKTHNGCWDVNHFIFCKGDSVFGQHSSFGYIDYNQFPPVYTHIDSLPSYVLKDFANFPFSQLNGYGNIERYFVLVTDNFIYSYSTLPSSSFLPPTTLRIDSIATPQSFSTCCMINDTLLAVASMLSDSIHCDYTVYTLPHFNIDHQYVLLLKPEKISGGYGLSNELIVTGDSSGIQRLVEINAITHQITHDGVLPDVCSNIHSLAINATHYSILSSSGDTITYLTTVNQNTFVSTIDTLSTGFGVALAEVNIFHRLFYQLSKDTGATQFDKKLLSIALFQSSQIDTTLLNVKCRAMHYNVADGFGPQIYFFIFAPDDTISNKAILTDYFFNITDTIYTPKNPTWFAEDFRCYLGMNEINKHLSLNVYPNPANDEVELMATGLQKNITYTFEILDAKGNALYIRAIESKQNYVIPLEEMPAGTLLLRVSGNGASVTKKIIKI